MNTLQTTVLQKYCNNMRFLGSRTLWLFLLFSDFVPNFQGRIHQTIIQSERNIEKQKWLHVSSGCDLYTTDKTLDKTDNRL